MKYEGLIEKYLQNSLSSDEKRMFEELLKNDADFSDEVAFHNNLKRAVQKEDQDNFRNLISGLEKKTEKVQKRGFRFMFLAAASIVILVGLSYFLKVFNQPSDDDLFAAYFQPYENVISPVERGNVQTDEQARAFHTYEEGDYESAILLFSELYNSTNEHYYLFYKANALLKLERANEAIPLLVEHLRTEDALAGKTKWYLALAYLKEKDKKNAKKFLKEVIKDGKYKTKDAKELLGKID